MSLPSIAAITALLLLVAPAPPQTTEAATTTRATAPEIVSTGSSGHTFSADVKISAINHTGRYVVFGTTASLTSNDRDDSHDLYRKDRVTGETVLVSVVPDQPSTVRYIDADISADGSRIAFVGTMDEGANQLVWVRDVDARRTRTFSATYPENTELHTMNSPKLSADGRFVVVDNHYDEIVEVDANGKHLQCAARVLRFNVQTGESLDVLDGTGQTGDLLEKPSVSADGRFVLVNGWMRGQTEGFHAHLMDTQKHTVAMLPTPAGHDGSGAHAILSANARYVALDASQDNQTTHAFRWDTHTGKIVRLAKFGARVTSISADGSQVVLSAPIGGERATWLWRDGRLVHLSTFWSRHVRVSGDGRTLAFVTTHDYPGDRNGKQDAYVMKVE